jgi:hypothetical protein
MFHAPAPPRIENPESARRRSMVQDTHIAIAGSPGLEMTGLRQRSASSTEYDDVTCLIGPNHS